MNVPGDSHVLREIAERTARMEGALLGDEGFITRTSIRLNDHTNRIRRLEYFRTGAVVVVAALLWLITHNMLDVAKVGKVIGQ